MHLSRAVLIALALCASDAAALPQFSFNFGVGNTPKENSNSHSNPEPTTSADQAMNSLPSNAGNLFGGWFGGSNQQTSSELDSQKTSLTNNAAHSHTPVSSKGSPGVFSDPKSEFASYFTLAEAISTAGYIYTDLSPREKETKPTSRPSNGPNGNSQSGDSRKLTQAGRSAPSITHGGTAQSKGKLPVSTGVVGALPGFFDGIASTLKEQGYQSQFSQVRSIENHAKSDMEEWKQGSKPTSALKGSNKPYETSTPHIYESSRAEGPSNVHQSTSARSSYEDGSRPSSERPASQKYSITSFKMPGGTTISSRPVAEPSKATGRGSESLETRASEHGSYKSSDHEFATQSGRAPQSSGEGPLLGQPEPSVRGSNGWLDGLISRLHGNPPAASQKPSVSTHGPVSSPESSRQPEDLPRTSAPSKDNSQVAQSSGLRSKPFGASQKTSVSAQGPVNSHEASHQYGGLPETSAPSKDHSQAAQSSRSGEYHPTASMPREEAGPSPPGSVPSSVESYLQTLPEGVSGKSVEEIIGGTPGLPMPDHVLGYLKGLPSEYKTLPLESIYSHRLTALVSSSMSSNIGSLSRGAPIPTNVHSFLDNLPSGRASLPINSFLGNEDVPGEIKSYLKDLPSEVAKAPIKSLTNGMHSPTTPISISKEPFGVPLPTEFSSILKGLSSEASALPVKSLLSKYPGQFPSNIKSYLHDLPSDAANLPIKSGFHAFPQPTPPPPKISLAVSIPANLNSALHNLPSEATALPMNSILSKYPDQLPSDIKSFFNGIPSEAMTLPFESFKNGFPHPTPSAKGPHASLSDNRAQRGSHGSAGPGSTPLPPLEHSKLPKPTGLQVSAPPPSPPLFDSLEPLQSALESYLSRGGISAPTGAAESAISHYLGSNSSVGGHLPSQPNAVESVIASLWGGLGSPPKSSAHNSEHSQTSPALSSLHFGPGPVVLSTRSIEKVTQSSMPNAASNVPSSLKSVATAKETRKVATSPVSSLSKPSGVESGIRKPGSLSNALPTPSILPPSQSRPLQISDSTRKTSIASTNREPFNPFNPHPTVTSLISETNSHSTRETSAANTDREPFNPFNPHPTATSLISETNLHITGSSNPFQPKPSVYSFVNSISSSIKSAANDASKLLPTSQLSLSYPTQKTGPSMLSGKSTVPANEKPKESKSSNSGTRTRAQESGVPTVFTELPVFSKLSTLLGASAASSILKQTAHHVPTTRPELSSLLGHFSSQAALSAKSTPAGVTPSTPRQIPLPSGFTRFSSALGASKSSENPGKFTSKGQSGNPTHGAFPSEISQLSTVVGASKVSETFGKLTSKALESGKPTGVIHPSQFSQVSSGTSKASETPGKLTSEAIKSGKPTGNVLPLQFSQESSASGSRHSNQVTPPSEFSRLSSVLSPSKSSEILGQITSNVAQSGKPTLSPISVGIPSLISAHGPSKTSEILSHLTSKAVEPGKATSAFSSILGKVTSKVENSAKATSLPVPSEFSSLSSTFKQSMAPSLTRKPPTSLPSQGPELSSLESQLSSKGLKSEEPTHIPSLSPSKPSREPSVSKTPRVPSVPERSSIPGSAVEPSFSSLSGRVSSEFSVPTNLPPRPSISSAGGPSGVKPSGLPFETASLKMSPSLESSRFSSFAGQATVSMPAKVSQMPSSLRSLSSKVEQPGFSTRGQSPSAVTPSKAPESTLSLMGTSSTTKSTKIISRMSFVFGSSSSVSSQAGATLQGMEKSSVIVPPKQSSPSSSGNPKESKQSTFVGSDKSTKSLGPGSNTMSAMSSEITTETRPFEKPSERPISTGILKSIFSSISGTNSLKVLPTASSKSIVSSLKQSESSVASSKYQLSENTISGSVPYSVSETRISSVESALSSGTRGEIVPTSPSYALPYPASESVVSSNSIKPVSNELTSNNAGKPTQESFSRLSPSTRSSVYSLAYQDSRGQTSTKDTLLTGLSRPLSSSLKSEPTSLNPTIIYLPGASMSQLSSNSHSRVLNTASSEVTETPATGGESTSHVKLISAQASSESTIRSTGYDRDTLRTSLPTNIHESHVSGSETFSPVQSRMASETVSTKTQLVGSSLMPTGIRSSNSDKFESVTRYSSKAISSQTEGVTITMQSSTTNRGEDNSATPYSGQASISPTASQEGSSNTILSPSSVQSPSERLPGLSSIISSLRAQSTLLSIQSSLLNSAEGLTSTVSLPESLISPSGRESTLSLGQSSSIRPQESDSPTRHHYPSQPTVPESALSTSQARPLNTAQSSSEASQEILYGATRTIPTIATFGSSQIVRQSSSMSSERLNSMKPEKSKTPTVSTSLQQQFSMTTSSSQEIPTTSRFYSEIKSSEVPMTILTTNVLSPERSSMLVADRTSLSFSVNTETSSSDITLSTPVSQEMSRISSSTSIEPTASFSQAGTNSLKGLSSSQPAETKSSLAPLNSLTRDSPGIAQSSSASVSQVLTSSSSSVIEQTRGLSSSTFSSPNFPTTTPASIQEQETRFSNYLDSPSAFSRTSSMNHLSAELSSMSSSSKSASVASEVSLLSSLAFQQSEISFSFATRSQDVSASLSTPETMRSEIYTLSSSNPQSGFPATQTGESSKPFSATVSNTANPQSSSFVWSSAIPTNAASSSTVISQEPLSASSDAGFPTVQSGASAKQSFKGDYSSATMTKSLAELYSSSTSTFSTEPLPTNSLSLGTSWTGDSFTTPERSRASSSVASDTQSSLNQISSLESVQSTATSTVSSSEYETNLHYFKITRSESSPTAIARSSQTEVVLSSEAQSPGSRTSERLESSLSTTLTQSMSRETEPSTVLMLSETQGTSMLSYSSSVAQASNSEPDSQAPRSSSVSTKGRSTLNSEAGLTSTFSYQSMPSSNGFSSTEQVSSKSTATQSTMSAEASSISTFSPAISYSDRSTLRSSETYGLLSSVQTTFERMSISSQVLYPSATLQVSGPSSMQKSSLIDSSPSVSQNTVLTNYVSSSYGVSIMPTRILTSQESSFSTSAISVEKNSPYASVRSSETPISSMDSSTWNSESSQQSTELFASLRSTAPLTMTSPGQDSVLPTSLLSQARSPTASPAEFYSSEPSASSAQQTSSISENESRSIMSTQSPSQQMISSGSSYGQISATFSIPQATLETPSTTQRASSSVQTNSVTSSELQAEISTPSTQLPPQMSVTNVESTASIPMKPSSVSSEASMPSPTREETGSMSLPAPQRTFSAISLPEVAASTPQPTSSGPGISMSSQYRSQVVTISQMTEGTATQTRSADVSLGSQQSSGATSTIVPIGTQSSLMTASNVGGTQLMSTSIQSEFSSSPSGAQATPSLTTSAPQGAETSSQSFFYTSSSANVANSLSGSLSESTSISQLTPTSTPERSLASSSFRSQYTTTTSASATESVPMTSTAIIGSAPLTYSLMSFKNGEGSSSEALSSFSTQKMATSARIQQTSESISVASPAETPTSSMMSQISEHPSSEGSLTFSTQTSASSGISEQTPTMSITATTSQIGGSSTQDMEEHTFSSTRQFISETQGSVASQTGPETIGSMTRPFSTSRVQSPSTFKTQTTRTATGLPGSSSYQSQFPEGSESASITASFETISSLEASKSSVQASSSVEGMQPSVTSQESQSVMQTTAVQSSVVRETESQYIPSKASAYSETQVLQSSQGTVPSSLPSSTRTPEVQTTWNPMMASSGTIKPKPEVNYNGQSAFSVSSTSTEPTNATPTSSQAGNSMSALPPQSSVSQISSAQEAITQPSTFDGSSDTTSSAAAIQSSGLGQASPSSMGNAGPSLTSMLFQSLTESELSTVLLSTGRVAAASSTAVNSIPSSSQASSAIEMKSSVVVEPTTPAIASGMSTNQIETVFGSSSSPENSPTGSLAQSGSSESQVTTPGGATITSSAQSQPNEGQTQTFSNPAISISSLPVPTDSQTVITTLVSTNTGGIQTVKPTVITTQATGIAEVSVSESVSDNSAQYTSTGTNTSPFSTGTWASSTVEIPTTKSSKPPTDAKTNQPTIPSISSGLQMTRGVETSIKMEASSSIPLPSSTEAQNSQKTVPSSISPPQLTPGSASVSKDSYSPVPSSTLPSIESYSLVSGSQGAVVTPSQATKGSEVASSMAVVTSSQELTMSTLSPSGYMVISESEAVTVRQSSEVSSLTPISSAHESPIAPTSISPGFQPSGSALPSTQPQPSNIIGPSSSSKVDEMTSPGKIQESTSTLQVSISSEGISNLQTSSPVFPESGELSTPEPGSTSLSETNYRPSSAMTTQELQKSIVSGLSTKADLTNEMPFTSEPMTEVSGTMTPQPAASSLPPPLPSSKISSPGEVSSTQETEASKATGLAAQDTISQAATLANTSNRPATAPGPTISMNGVQKPDSSSTVKAGIQTEMTRLSNTNELGMKPTGQTTPMVSQSAGSSQNSEGQLPETTPVPPLASDTTRSPMSTQGLDETASLVESSTFAASQSLPIESQSPQSSLAPSDVNSAGVVTSQHPESSASTVSVIYATETFISNSRYSLAATDSTDTSFLDFGTSTPADIGQSTPASASQSITSSSAVIVPVAPVNTGEASNDNGEQPEPPVNMPAGQHGQGLTHPDKGQPGPNQPPHTLDDGNGQGLQGQNPTTPGKAPGPQSGEQNNTPPKSPNPPHVDQVSQDGNNGRPVSSQNGDQKENKPAHQDHGTTDSQSSRPPTAGNGDNQGSPPAQKRPPQLANPVKVGDQSPAATQPNHIGLTFAPNISDKFNFYDGAVFDPAGNSMTSGADRMAQAREINANLPPEIQSAFNTNSISYYNPGTGDFYYSKVCSDAACSIVQVAKSCNCYVNGGDQQLRYLTFDQGGELEGSTFNHNARLPPATKHSVQSGDTLFEISAHYGVELALILAANPDILNPDVIAVGQVINIPAQAYMVVKGDYLDAIAKAHGVSLPALESLNDQVENHDLIFPGQMIKVPSKGLGDPFCTTVEPGDSLSSIADKWHLTLSSVEAVNPQIQDKNLIFPKQVVNVSIYLPVQSNLTSDDSCPICEMGEKSAPTLSGAKFARAVAAPKIVATTIEVGPTATIIAKAPAVTGDKRPDENNSWVGKGEAGH